MWVNIAVVFNRYFHNDYMRNDDYIVHTKLTWLASTIQLE
jgi:hypothetical protein